MPVLIVAIPIIVGSQTALTEKKMAAYGRAGGFAKEVLNSIRTVICLWNLKSNEQSIPNDGQQLRAHAESILRENGGWAIFN